MTPSRKPQLIGVVVATVFLVLALMLAPGTSSWWQKTLGVIFAVTFALRAAALLSGGGPPPSRMPRWMAWLSTVPLFLLAIACLHLPETWAVWLAVGSWLASFATRRFWQP